MATRKELAALGIPQSTLTAWESHPTRYSKLIENLFDENGELRLRIQELESAIKTLSKIIASK